MNPALNESDFCYRHNGKRFKTWWHAAQRTGLIFMLTERLFFVISFLSLVSARAYVGKRALGERPPKLWPPRKDLLKITLHVIFGVLLPITLISIETSDSGLGVRKYYSCGASEYGELKNLLGIMWNLPIDPDFAA